MDKMTICTLKYGEVIYKVNALIDKEGKEHGFRVMRDRTIAKGGNLFFTEREAVRHMLRVAFADVSQLNLPWEQ